MLYEDRYPNETHPDWGDPRRHGYAMGKLIAERSFAQAAARSGRWEAIACLPSDNVGPIQSAHQKAMGRLSQVSSSRRVVTVAMLG